MIGKVQVRADLVANVTKPQWVADRYKVVASAAAGMVGFDLEAHDRGEDGFHKWRKDGIATLTESVLNVASIRIPGAGAAKTVLGSTKAGAAAVKALNMTTRLADYAVPGGGWLVRGSETFWSLSSCLCKWLGLVGLGESFGVADGEFVEGSGPALDGKTLNQFPGGRALGSGFAGLFGSFTGPLVLDVADRQPH